MMIKQFILQNFRNYIDETVHFEAGTNILVGDNGQGKTNALEGIYYLLTGKSYRVKREQELLRWEQDAFYLRGDFLPAFRGALHLESYYSRQKKVIKINHIPCKRLSDFVGTVNVIFFSPDDLVMIKGGPLERRRFLDFHIAQMRPGHVGLLNDYGKTLKQKNALLNSLGDERLKYAGLHLWNEQLVRLGEKIIRNREDLAKRLQNTANQIYENLTSQKEKLRLTYLALGNEDINKAILEFPHLLEVKLEQEIKRRTALIGPHRDDLQILLNEKPARYYASQGQQRSIVLSLKLAELELIRQEKEEYPLLLLDDVLSELDNFRREYLMRFIGSSGIQTLLTMTNAETQLVSGTFFKVEKGHMRRG